MPSSYGFVNGEPLMLSMLSSFRGQRDGGGYAGVFGIAGLKLEVEGTRTGEGCVTWRAREAAVGLVGDAGRTTGAEGMRATLRGFLGGGELTFETALSKQKGKLRKGDVLSLVSLGVGCGRGKYFLEEEGASSVAMEVQCELFDSRKNSQCGG
jgi:hypothetical protein